MQQAESKSQEEGDIPDKAEREEEQDALPTIRMTLAMIFLRSSVDMVKVRSEDLDCAEIGAIGWTLSVLATVAAEIETVDLLRDSKSQYCGQNVCKNYKNVC